MLFDFSNEICSQLDCGDTAFLMDTGSESSVAVHDLPVTVLVDDNQ